MLDFLNNPVVLTMIVAVWGLFLRFSPAFAKVPNYLIPALSAVLALLIKLAAPGDAHAQDSAVVTTMGLDTLAVVAASASGPTLWTKIIAAIGQGLLNALFYDKFLRTPAVAQFATPKKRSHHAREN